MSRIPSNHAPLKRQTERTALTISTDTDTTLTFDHIDGFRDDFASDPRNRLMQNTVTQRDVNEVALDHDIVTNATHTFSTLLDEWTPTQQGNSGRCWLFSGLNLFRVDTMKTLNTRQFEYSQNYMMFWDKVERANFILEAVIETADRPTDDRIIQHLMTAPVEDAGQWDMFVNLVDKYGVVPKEAMPETESSGNTRQMNNSLYYQVRQGAARIRQLYKDEAGLDAMRQAKMDTLTAVYRILCIHLGNPPSVVDWQWRDQEGKFHRDGELTPLDFADRYISTDYRDMVCLVNDPRPDHPYFQTYTISYLGNVVGARSVRYLNVPVEVMKDITLRQLLDGRPGVDGLRHRKAEPPQARTLGRQPVRLRRGLRLRIRHGQGRPTRIRPDSDDPRHALHRRGCSGRRPSPLARRE